MKHGIKWLWLVCLLALILSGCSGSSISVGTNPNGNQSYGGSQSGNNSSSGSSNTSTGEANWGKQTKTSGCRASGGIQDKECTPGAIIASATAAKICVQGYSKSVRNVPVSEKNQVYASYGISHHTAGQYEVDHLISLELGGSNDISNLWPELASPKPGFHEKDKVENYLHAQVCNGKISLKTAQTEIANNWLDVYNKMPKSSQYDGASE
ncbi:hypothetical protein KDW_49840 [Dictyobacter vulcani]|uniref:HNH endonuclease n=1 Tax=Dictyobacter vulcani TaxID=2607529 RepID=A0A5J4KUF0_9CHLR|nr:HNH endonuclease signature motif containing protein [Dictyobacter vulcani]GER90822.1 hypothetical protein KDW_49840 [Dictyobacter vulcani]